MSPLPMDLGGGGGDLLPPSPSVVSPIQRPFAHHPHNTSTGNSNPVEHTHPHQHSNPHPNAPPIPSLGDTASHPQPHVDPALKPPAIRPLDFMAFVASSAETHVELARTVDELSRWLAVVEGGLAGVLEKVAAGVEERNGIIQEEREGDERERASEG
ncbi:hypothetical protein JB92DRAFT_2904804 [Gautieria morchelliformis]|nr:hypothetical protein JB92DRAFT_2904804 [Gautieria morchelliformis]